jgi:predicted HAD superfamily phosphohydrolase
VKEEEDAITTYKEQLISQIDELFQRKIQYDIGQLRERIHQVQTGI